MEDPKTQLRVIIQEGREIHTGYESAKAQFERGEPIGQALTEAGVDFFKKEFGVKKKYTRPFAIGLKKRWETTPSYTEMKRSYDRWCGQVIKFLSEVSMATASLQSTGNSERLLRRWRSSQKGKRLETRIKHALHALETLEMETLIFNKDIPSHAKKKPKEVFITAGRRIKGESELERLLSNEVDTFLKICDPYVSKDTLKYLEVVPLDVPVQVLTTYITNQSRFEDSLTVLRRKRRIEVLRVGMDEGGTPIHDRYILTNGKGWIIGTSLKDIGKKDTTVSEIDSTRLFEERFDSYWVPSEIVIDGAKCSVKPL
jgi:hypothetical protein